MKQASAIEQINSFVGFSQFKPTWLFHQFIHSKANVKALFTGNQYGKSDSVAYQYVLRILGMHPIPERNCTYFECECGNTYAPIVAVLQLKNTCSCGKQLQKHQRTSKVFRFCSATLPGQSANISEHGISAEVKNTQYPAFKRRLPPFLIRDRGDITARNAAMIIQDIWDQSSDIMIDFVSYSQDVQNTAGPQRLSIWYDEQPGIDLREEQIPRLMKENGDEIFSLTPADHLTWVYDEIYEKAKRYIRTEFNLAALNADKKRKHNRIEETDSDKSIDVFCASTDDNPTMTKEAIEAAFSKIDDPDILAIRRHGFFKQISGRIFKDFEFKTHVIDGEKYFPVGIPLSYVHARGIDYHPQTPWAFVAISLSPDNEAFVWLDSNFSPEKMTTREIAYEYSKSCGRYEFRLNKIDGESETIKKDKVSVLDDLNRCFKYFKQEGVGTGGYWSTWDTKGERGRDSIRERLKNSLLCGRPFNNFQRNKETGRLERLPTIWIFNTCKHVTESMRHWRWQEYANTKLALLNGDKNKPEQKHSHHMMVLEAIFKEQSFRPRVISQDPLPRSRTRDERYFQGASGHR